MINSRDFSSKSKDVPVLEFKVYKLISVKTGYYYIGVSSNVERRMSIYRQRGTSSFDKQRKLKEYIGEWSFDFEVEILERFVIGEYNTDKIGNLEGRWILREYMKNPDKMLNIVVPGFGRVYNDVMINPERVIKNSSII